MKLHEVLKLPDVVSGDLWFRPVVWAQGTAYVLKDGVCYGVPSARGGYYGICAHAATLAGEWEAVTSGEVLS